MRRGQLIVVAVLALAFAVAGRADKPKDGALAPLVRVLTASDDVDVQRDVLRGTLEALQGRRQVPAPASWAAAYRKLSGSPDREVREKALVLAVLFDDRQALTELRQTITDAKADESWRRFALQTLIDKRPADLAAVLRDLLADPALRGSALRGLAACNDPTTPAVILQLYATLTESEKADAVGTLASRKEYALTLLDAMERGAVARRDLSPFTARQLIAMKDKKLTDRLGVVWGTVRAPAQDKTALMTRYKALATPDALQKADRRHGRALFVQLCANCHTLFDAGGKIGPELTGSQRANPEYILTKVLDPNAVVPSDYQVSVVATKAGRVITGIVKMEDDKTLALQTSNELVRVPKADIEERAKIQQSMMPEGALANRGDAEVRDLLAYLAGSGQVPLPK